MKEQILQLPKLHRIDVSFVVYLPTRCKTDIDNNCVLHSKWFMDSLTAYSKLDDDDYKHVPAIHYYYGGIDKDNPRVEIYIRS